MLIDPLFSRSSVTDDLGAMLNEQDRAFRRLGYRVRRKRRQMLFIAFAGDAFYEPALRSQPVSV